jgi:hypothetical protein
MLQENPNFLGLHISSLVCIPVTVRGFVECGEKISHRENSFFGEVERRGIPFLFWRDIDNFFLKFNILLLLLLFF